MVQLVTSKSSLMDGNGRVPFRGTIAKMKNAIGLRDSIQFSGIVNPKGLHPLIEPWNPVLRESFAPLRPALY